MTVTPSFSRRLKHWSEYLLVRLEFGIFRLMPFKAASDTAGLVARHLGPFFPVTHTATRNLARAFPEWTEEKHDAVMRGMWENIGRYGGEFPHIVRMTPAQFFERCELVGGEHLESAKDQASLFFSCHMGNWELGAKATHDAGVPLSVVYRPLNNPLVDKLINSYRNQYQQSGIPKSAAGSRELLSAMKNNGRVAILMDQKLSSGKPVPFFGHDAMTASSLADLALKFDAPIYPVRVERLEGDAHGPRFRVTVYPPMDYNKTGDVKQDADAILNKMHGIMESWITERPEQWFWLHNRWSD